MIVALHHLGYIDLVTSRRLRRGATVAGRIAQRQEVSEVTLRR